MAITSSAKKVIRAAARKRLFNLERKKAVAEAVKKVRKFVADKKFSEAAALLPETYKAIDKAMKTKYLKKNTAARMKSRLTLLVNKKGK